jgi:hypothetical protein
MGALDDVPAHRSLIPPNYGLPGGRPDWPRPTSCRRLSARRATARPATARATPDQVRTAVPCWLAVARAGPGRNLRTNRFQAVCLRLYLISGGVQRATHELDELVPLSRTALRVAIGSHHNSCSRAARREVMPRAVWLFTAPRLIPIAVAISASDRSA